MRDRGRRSAAIQRVPEAQTPSRRVLLPFVLAAVALVATACGERKEPVGPDVSLYPVTVETGDRPLVATAPAKRIVVLDATTDATIRALGIGGRIVGKPIDETGRIDFQALRRARPDLIVARAGSDLLDLSRAHEVTGAQVYSAPGDSIEEVERAITHLGLLTGRPVVARALVRAIEKRRREVREAVAGTAPVRVFVDRGFFTTVSDATLAGDLIAEANGRNVGGDHAEAGPFDREDLVRLDPDLYLATSQSKVTLAQLRADPVTQQLRAVKEGRFAVVDDALLVPGPRVGDALLEIARVLHPNAFR